MQTANVNVPVKVTGRHISITDAIREYAKTKLEHIHLDYPRIIEAHVILDVTKHRQSAEIVLHCANHITIEADHECDDMYAAIDGVIAKIAQQMRKYKTKMLRSHRPRKNEARHFEEQVLHIDEHFELHEESEAKHVETERVAVRTLFVDEAIIQLEMAANRPFVVFVNAKTDQVNILQRRKAGGFGLIEVSLPG
jgi:putative sigma-54 modulation protein